MNTSDIAAAKMRAVVSAAATLRQGHWTVSSG
jgi:hypothetical protein